MGNPKIGKPVPTFRAEEDHGKTDGQCPECEIVRMVEIVKEEKKEE